MHVHVMRPSNKKSKILRKGHVTVLLPLLAAKAHSTLAHPWTHTSPPLPPNGISIVSTLFAGLRLALLPKPTKSYAYSVGRTTQELPLPVSDVNPFYYMIHWARAIPLSKEHLSFHLFS